MNHQRLLHIKTRFEQVTRSPRSQASSALLRGRPAVRPQKLLLFTYHPILALPDRRVASPIDTLTRINTAQG